MRSKKLTLVSNPPHSQSCWPSLKGAVYVGSEPTTNVDESVNDDGIVTVTYHYYVVPYYIVRCTEYHAPPNSDAEVRGPHWASFAKSNMHYRINNLYYRRLTREGVRTDNDTTVEVYKWANTKEGKTFLRKAIPIAELLEARGA